MEKPSQNEGKAVKFTLEEVAFILRVISGESLAWKTIHSYGGQETPISFEWDSEYIDKVMVKAGDYQKLLNYGEIEVFKALLPHVFQEKVIASTDTKTKKRENSSEFEKKTVQRVPEEMAEVETKPVPIVGVCGEETEKAILITFEGNKEIWVPKSAIRSSYDSNITTSQNFEIDPWILKKNNIMYREVLS